MCRSENSEYKLTRVPLAEAALGFLVSRIAGAALPPREVTIDSPLIRRGSTEKSCLDNFRLFFALSNISLLRCQQKVRYYEQFKSNGFKLKKLCSREPVCFRSIQDGMIVSQQPRRRNNDEQTDSHGSGRAGRGGAG